MFFGIAWKYVFCAALLYMAASVVFWAVTSIYLHSDKREAIMVNIAVGLFLVAFAGLYFGIHKIIRNYTVYMPVDGDGTKFDGRNVVALILAGVITYVIIRCSFSRIKRK